jgi:CheY-like chemotaxis protein
MVRAVRPDLILVDYHMPAMNGREVVKQLKAGTETRRIPVMGLDLGDGRARERTQPGWCVGFIPKPFEPTEFLRLVAEFLNETVGRSRRSSDPHRGS